MRSCLVQLGLAIVVILAVLWIALPIGAGFLALGALRAGGFSGSGTTVDVSASPPFTLLVGHADAVRLRSSDAAFGDVQAASLDLTFDDVNLFSRSFATVHGALADVGVPAVGGGLAVASSVTLAGPSGAVEASLLVPLEQAESLAATRLSAVVGEPAQVTFAAPDRVTVSVGGRSVGARLVVRQGSLVLAPDTSSLPAVSLVASGSGNPFTLSGVSIAADGLHLDGTADVSSILH